jgi:hypothetical protein
LALPSAQKYFKDKFFKFQEETMAKETEPHTKSFTLSLDSWAVILALILALAVRFALLPKVPW